MLRQDWILRLVIIVATLFVAACVLFAVRR
jgi:hypothetical protein